MGNLESINTSRSNSSELQNRIDIVIELLAQKLKRAQIIEYLATHQEHWKVGEKTIDKYVRKARAQLLDQMRITRTELRGEAVNDLRYLYKKALDDNDVRAALAVRKELTDLLALKGPVINEEDVPGEREAEDQAVPGAVDELMEKHFEVLSIPDSTEPDAQPEVVVPTPLKEKPGPVLSKYGY